MPFRLQCDLCGAKSAEVQDAVLTAREAQMIDEFKTQHRECVPDDPIVYPDLCVSVERPIPQCGPFGSHRPPPLSARSPHGHFERTGPYGEQEEGDTLSCCHCRKNWEVRVGSGKTRGFCSLCFNGKPGSGYTCGSPKCDVHVPYELRLENLEAGRPVLTPPRPQIVVPCGASEVLSRIITPEDL